MQTLQVPFGDLHKLLPNPTAQRTAELCERIDQVELRIAALSATLERVRRQQPGGSFAELRRTLDGARALLAQMQRARARLETSADE